MKKKFLCLILALMSVLPLAAQHSLEVKIQKGEKWWGPIDDYTNASIDNPAKVPYDEGTVLGLDLFSTSYANQAVPFLVSGKGRYIWSDGPFRVRFEEGVIRLSGSEPIILREEGKTLREAFTAAASRHFPASGNIPPEEFLASPQYNTWIELTYNQNQEDILRYARSIVSNGFPTDAVLMIDDNWQKYYGSYEFKPERFPDAKGMVEELHAMGFKVVLWVCPFISPDSFEYRELRDRGLLVLDVREAIDATYTPGDKEDPAIIKWWNGFSAMLDFSNPEAVGYFEAKLKGMQQKYGIDGFKLDAGDANFYPEGKIRVKDGISYGPLHTELWAKIGLDFPYNEYRACWKMGGQPLVQRLSDKDYSWDAVQMLVPSMILAGLLGHVFTCPDMIGGGEFRTFIDVQEDEFDQDLIVRSCQVHALMPMMQFSVAPWRILDARHLEICRGAAWLHRQFAPYILSLARKGAETGEPIVRSMDYVFPGQGFEGCTDQFMLGDEYLVAPVTSPAVSRTVKLPAGRWTDELGKKYKGGKTYTIDVPIERLPYFKKTK